VALADERDERRTRESEDRCTQVQLRPKRSRLLLEGEHLALKGNDKERSRDKGFRGGKGEARFQKPVLPENVPRCGVQSNKAIVGHHICGVLVYPKRGG
jgi:hypothetical protein